MANETGEQLIVSMILTAWEVHIKRVDNLLANLSDEQLLKHTAPDRNRGIYLLGHLVAAHDAMQPLLGFGEKTFPQLEEPFLKNADDETAPMPSVAELRVYWHQVNTKLAEDFAKMQSHDWLGRHTAVSEHDFAKEPFRNKLNIIISRTNHLSYHFGQLIFLKDKPE